MIFDTTQGNHFAGLRLQLTSAGRYLSLYVTARALWEMVATIAIGGPRMLAGVSLGSPAQIEDLRVLVEAGAIRASIAQRFPLSQIVGAHCCLESTGLRGSVVIDVVPQEPARRDPMQGAGDARAMEKQPERRGRDRKPLINITQPRYWGSGGRRARESGLGVYLRGATYLEFAMGTYRQPMAVLGEDGLLSYLELAKA